MGNTCGGTCCGNEANELYTDKKDLNQADGTKTMQGMQAVGKGKGANNNMSMNLARDSSGVS
jgi:hypothetical protein